MKLMIWAPQLLYQALPLEHLVMRPVFLLSAFPPPAALPQAVQQTPPSPKQVKVPSMRGG